MRRDQADNFSQVSVPDARIHYFLAIAYPELRLIIH